MNKASEEHFFDTNEDYEMLTRAINVLKYQEERARDDIATLKKRKLEALEDPITFVEKLRDGTNKKLPKRQIVFKCPNIKWSKYTWPSKNGTTSNDAKLTPYGIKYKSKIPSLARSSELMEEVLKGAAELGLYPEETPADEGSDRESEAETPLSATGLSNYGDESNRNTIATASTAASSTVPYGKGKGKKMLSALLSPAEVNSKGAKRSTVESSDGIKKRRRDSSARNPNGSGELEVNNNTAEIDSMERGKGSIVNYTQKPQTSLSSASTKVNQNSNSETLDPKPNNHNIPWTDEEQQRLIELLAIYPDEEIQSHRFKKISKALGTRTPKQVASRVQKYFIKLAKNGLPVPGRMPNLQGRVSKVKASKPPVEQSSRRPRVSGIAYEQALPPPTVYMAEGDDESVIKEMMISINNNEKNIVMNNDKERPSPSSSSYWNAEDSMEDVIDNIHRGFSCDSCLIDPIIGTRYQCLDCNNSSRQVDLCEDCMNQGDFENEHHKITHRFTKFTKYISNSNSHDSKELVASNENQGNKFQT
ncbi:13522_t:CDS:10 [Ambispora leptoticha]|uniref:13522_t:CDS:1 n=1 Tax=Ambispora leptoticha TaxID=144679 RepID=A0A9N8WQV1_9GLOM|nr:13522_t:CDS:10 [Ambispora leptoticha]